MKRNERCTVCLPCTCRMKVDMRLPGKGNSNFHAGPPNHFDDRVDSDQYFVKKELALNNAALFLLAAHLPYHTYLHTYQPRVLYILANFPRWAYRGTSLTVHLPTEHELEKVSSVIP